MGRKKKEVASPEIKKQDKAPPKETSSFDVVEQDSTILNDEFKASLNSEDSENSTSQEMDGENSAPSLDEVDNDKMYNTVADSIHQALAGIVSLTTNKAVQIDENQIGRLNDSGVMLLKKYDTNGKLLEYSPEIAYVLTLADISAQVYIEMRKKKGTAKKETPEEKKPEPMTNTKQEVKDFGAMLKK